MKNARRIWLSIHLYLGLSIGAVLVLLGLTGSILVFYLDIDQILNPQMEPTSVPYKMPAQQDILDALQQAHAPKFLANRTADAYRQANYGALLHPD